VVDDVWDRAGAVIPELKSSAAVQATGEFKVLWDDEALYTLFIVRDSVLNKASMNTYEQDSVEVFLDEANNKAMSYQSDDVHYRVNYENTPSADSGDPDRFTSATSLLKDESGNVIGYIAETAVTWTNPPANETIMGFELQINDAGDGGTRAGTVNIFDNSNSAWQNPSVMGELILKGKEGGTTAGRNTGMLNIYIKMAERVKRDNYINGHILDEPLKAAKEILDNESSSQAQIDAAVARLKEAIALLDDGSGFVSADSLTANEELPDPFTFFDGTPVNSSEDWNKRADEIARLYEYYMYGVMPDTSDEKVSYAISGSEMTITVEKGGKKVSFPVNFSVPDKNKAAMPEGGYPVLIAYLWLTQTEYANNRGYAVITLNTELIAADNWTRSGAFYELYPYGDKWTEQTGALMAWSWGVSKILDALEAGAGKELNINPAYNIMTGVSRWGKAAAVTGAFDKRIKVTAPSCSGAGGMAIFRCKSEGKTYDYSSLGIGNPYVMTANEPLGSLQSSSEQHWFNDNFLNFKNVNSLPFDQHMLAALCAEEGRCLFITGSYLYEDWTNPPAMWLAYLAAREVFEYLGLEDNIAIHLHKEGHMVTDEDMVYLLDFCNHHFYGKEIESNLDDLTKSLFLEPANYDPIYDKYLKN
jgi:endo-1,4-beta-xylanase